LKEIKSKSTRLSLLAKEAPEIPGILEEFELSLALLTGQLSPLLSSIQQIRLQNKPLATFIELKHNLLLSYCTFLSFYLLIRLSKDGDTAKSHPVLFKITTLKQTLDGL